MLLSRTGCVAKGYYKSDEIKPRREGPKPKMPEPEREAPGRSADALTALGAEHTGGSSVEDSVSPFLALEATEA